jgi:hypothetical protein
VKPFLAQYELIKKIVTQVKDEENNLNTLTSILLQVVNCEPLQLTSQYADACFGQAMNKI